MSDTIIPPRYREDHEQGLQHFFETEHGPVLDKMLEMKAIDKNNVEFDVALSISSAVVQDRQLLIGFIRNITETKKTEEKTRESQHVFSTLFYKSPAMKAIIDATTGMYIDVNDALADFLQLTRD